MTRKHQASGLRELIVWGWQHDRAAVLIPLTLAGFFTLLAFGLELIR